jgi:hypothetical protein
MGELLGRVARSGNRLSRYGCLNRCEIVSAELDVDGAWRGVVDLGFREEDREFAGWTVVDFKTDREFDAASARYIDQARGCFSFFELDALIKVGLLALRCHARVFIGDSW